MRLTGWSWAVWGGVAGVALGPVSAWAGTPAEEADRCTRYLAASLRLDAEAAVAISLEHLRPGEVPARFVTKATGLLRHNLEVIGSNIKDQGGIKSVEPLPDFVVEATGDIIRQQKWTDGKGVVSYVACASFPGEDDPWEMQVVIGSSQTSNLASMADTITSGTPSSRWGPPSKAAE